MTDDDDKVSGRRAQLVNDMYTPEIPDWAKSPDWNSADEIFVVIRVKDTDDGDLHQVEVFGSLPDNQMTQHVLEIALETVQQSVEHHAWKERYGRPSD